VAKIPGAEGNNRIPMVAVDQWEMIEHRRKQEIEHWDKIQERNALNSILTIEINTTELCNRTCVFCPRHDPEVYDNRNLHLTVKGATIIAEELERSSFEGKISFSGFGENLLNPWFPEIIEVFRKHRPSNVIECNTNGDKLDEHYARRIFDAGMSIVYVNLYDGMEQVEHFDSLFDLAGIPQERYKYRVHWGGMEDHGLVLNNRSGVVDWMGIDESTIEAVKDKPCYYPFYKMFVDWNGDCILCCNDWNREQVVGNLITQSLSDVWFGKPMTKIRNKLKKGNRTEKPCNKCNVDGTLFGKPSFDFINALGSATDE
jgi:MoaA/NifB/PqqE/SkfB family radical SAM enzyme